jgi:hypothetical protein
LADDSLVSCSVSRWEVLTFDILDVSSISESISCSEQSALTREDFDTVDMVDSSTVAVDLEECLDVLEETDSAPRDTLDAFDEDSTLP